MFPLPVGEGKGEGNRKPPAAIGEGFDIFDQIVKIWSILLILAD